MKSNILVATVGLLSFLSSAAIADTSMADRHCSVLEKMIQENSEQKIAAESKKFSQITALAGNQQEELTKRKNEVTNTYTSWRNLKCAVEMSQNKATSKDLIAISVAAQAHSQAIKAFISLQKDILTNANIPSKDQAAYLVMR